MVAVIHASSSLRNALNYNEQKVKEQAATCLAAVNYPKDAQDLTFYQKLNRLQNQADLNTRTTVNSVHISLNFNPSEKLSEDRLKEIADVYLQKIGFAEQPYLLYQHYDSGHPHVHIVTTNIKADGKRIELHNLGKNQSENARKEIEQTFGLMKAEDSKQRQAYQLKPVNIQKVQYGRSEAKRAITNVLNAVLNTYKYSSLPELNAVLRQYNVLADRGSEGSRIFKNNGLVYRITDENGNKTGVPIKASDFYSKPDLKFLETKFKQNGTAKEPQKAWVKNAIDLALLKNPNHSVDSLIKALQKEGIHTVLRQNDKGLMYGITYVDHRTKCVYNGSDLGKQYSAKAIQERCGKSVAGEEKNILNIPQPYSTQNHTPQQHSIPNHTIRQQHQPLQQHATQKHTSQQHAAQNHSTYQQHQPLQHSSGSKTVFEPVPSLSQPHAEQPSLLKGAGKVVEILMRPEQTSDYVPGQLKGKKKKKKRMSNHL